MTLGEKLEQLRKLKKYWDFQKAKYSLKDNPLGEGR